MADNNDISKKGNHLSNAESTRQNDKGRGLNFRYLKEWLSNVREEYLGIAAIVSSCVGGVIAFWKGFGQWWFGFQLSLWIYFLLAAVLLVIWVVAFCGYYGEAHPERMPTRKKEEQEEKVKLRCLSLNVIVMIAIPVLLLGILGGYFAMDWRLTEKIVILVEPFEKIGEVQDDSTSGKDMQGIAETIKSSLERAIQESEKRLDVRVVLGERCEKERSEEVPLEEYALECRADMIISGWYVERGNSPNKEFLVCPKFRVVRVPKLLPEVFRAKASVYPETIVFSRREIENFGVNFTLKERLALGKLLTYEPMLMLGAGAYASENWKTAQQFFEKALSVKDGPNSIMNENLKGDEALLQLYIGHCLMNRRQYESAILRYDDAIKAGKKISLGDMRYGEILAKAYLARGVAYRQVNAFELAGQDFEAAGGYLPTSLGLRKMRVEDVKFLSGDREKLEKGAEKYYIRGEEYLIDREYERAQAYLEMSVEFYRILMREMPVPIQKKYSLGLARSLVRLGEIYNRLAKPELIHDKITQRAIKYLKEAVGLTKRFDNRRDPNMLKVRADGLRHLGEAYRAMDDINQVLNAFDCHQAAKEIWETMEPNDPERPEGIANELVRIGDVYRRLCSIDPTETKYKDRSSKAEQAYYNAALKLEETTDVNDRRDSYIQILNSYSFEEIDSCSVLLEKVMADITAHHLANSLGNLARTRLERYLRAQNKYKADPNTNPMPNEQDVIIAKKCLKFSVTCYQEAVNKLEKEKDKRWIEKINRKERNHSLTDDLSWCRTLHGYALLKSERISANGSTEKGNVYKEIEDELTKAKEGYEKLRYADQGHVVLNLFALTASQVELGKKQEAQQTFLDACKKLRDLTREKKKVWYVDYVYDIIENLPERGFQFGTDDDVGNLEKIEIWLTEDTVREGRYALDNIIESMKSKSNKPEDFGH